MTRWSVYRVRWTLAGGAGRSLEKLGQVLAPHQPAAKQRAAAKWPKVPPETMTVMLPPGKRLKAIREAQKINAEIRAAYANERKSNA